MEMTEERAREILAKYRVMTYLNNGGFEDSASTINFNHEYGMFVHLDDAFSPDELEALAFLMRNKGGEDGNN